MTTRLPATLALVAALAACGGDAAKTPAPGSEEQLMQQGLDQMYKSNAPVDAEASFRAVLAKNPAHYGAHYQLAVALDRGGKPTEARPAWEDMRQLAEAIKDTTTLAAVRRRLAAPDTASQDAMMALGLHYLYKTGDLANAAAQFRKVIARNSTHYGATYQLAKTLDLMNQRDQATPLWVRVLGMAAQYKDSTTIKQARDRLK